MRIMYVEAETLLWSVIATSFTKGPTYIVRTQTELPSCAFERKLRNYYFHFIVPHIMPITLNKRPPPGAIFLSFDIIL